MKKRVYKKPDGTVIYQDFAWDKKPAEMSDEDFMDSYSINFSGFDDTIKTYPYIDVDDAQLIESDSKKGSYHEQIYFNGACTLANLIQDTGWMECLMPEWLICEKHVNRVKNKIKTELDQGSPDAVQLSRFQDEKDDFEKIRYLHKDNPEISLQQLQDLKKLNEQALLNIIEDGHSKPNIVTKLNARITEIQSLIDSYGT